MGAKLTAGLIIFAFLAFAFTDWDWPLYVLGVWIVIDVAWRRGYRQARKDDTNQ